MTRAQRNHNPGNLRFAKQLEATGKDDMGFAVFPDDPAGFRALAAQIRLDANRGLTLGQFIAKFAPPTENDTNAYGDYLCSIAPTELRPRAKEIPLKVFNEWALAGMIAHFEGWTKK